MRQNIIYANFSNGCEALLPKLRTCVLQSRIIGNCFVPARCRGAFASIMFRVACVALLACRTRQRSQRCWSRSLFVWPSTCSVEVRAWSSMTWLLPMLKCTRDGALDEAASASIGLLARALPLLRCRFPPALGRFGLWSGTSGPAAILLRAPKMLCSSGPGLGQARLPPSEPIFGCCISMNAKHARVCELGKQALRFRTPGANLLGTCLSRGGCLAEMRRMQQRTGFC